MENFQYKPYKNVMVKEIAKLSKENFTKLFLSLGENFSVWSNGVLIHLTEFETSNKNDRTKYFEFIYYAECPKLPPYLEYNGFKLEVIDVSTSSFHKHFVEWLKHTSFWNEPSHEDEQ